MMPMSEEKSLLSKDANTGQTSYPRPSDAKLPENYTMRDGFLIKGGTLVSLVTSGIVEAAARGFLHVDETEEYRTG
jgi:hypothetical protein